MHPLPEKMCYFMEVTNGILVYFEVPPCMQQQGFETVTKANEQCSCGIVCENLHKQSMFMQKLSKQFHDCTIRTTKMTGSFYHCQCTDDDSTGRSSDVYTA